MTRVGQEEEDAGVAAVAFRGVAAAVLLDGGGVAAAAAPEGGLAPLVVLSLFPIEKWYKMVSRPENRHPELETFSSQQQPI